MQATECWKPCCSWPYLVLLMPGYVVITVPMLAVQHLGSAEHCLTLLLIADSPAVQAETLLRLQHDCL